VLLALELGFLLAIAGAVLGVLALASGVSIPPAPRLGRRGAGRRHALKQGGLFALAEPVIRFVAALVALIPAPAWRNRQELELRRASYPLGLTPDEYSALSILSALLLSVVVGALAKLNGSDVVVALPAAAFGAILPVLQVQEIVRGRIKEVSRGLPHAIEIAAMCMGAGLDFPGSLRQLTEPNSGAKNALPQEFATILEELDLGHTRREALLGFADRVPTQAVRDFVNAVIQAEQRGNPLARVIQVQGRMLNMRRSVAAEEAAARAGVLMIGPMVLLVMCILLLLMGPFFVKGIGF
jgi:tight adherence protein C